MGYTGELATTGLAIGAAVGGAPGAVIGGIAGGIIGAGIDIYNWFTGQQNQKTQNDIAQAQVDLAKAAADEQKKLQIAELQVKQSAYEDFLSKIPIAGQSLSVTTGDVEFDQQYRALLENYGNVNVMAGMTGRVGAGTTGAALGQQASDIMSGFVTAEQQRAQQQLDIYTASLDILDPQPKGARGIGVGGDFFNFGFGAGRAGNAVNLNEPLDVKLKRNAGHGGMTVV